jgi:hypothetical protein
MSAYGYGDEYENLVEAYPEIVFVLTGLTILVFIAVVTSASGC